VSAAAQPEPTRRGRLTDLARRFDPQTWSGALSIMVAAGALLWAIEIINVISGYALNRYGMDPRSLRGLEGIVTMPLLHTNALHLLADIFPFIIIGWMALVGGGREFLLTTLLVVLGGGLATWLIGPQLGPHHTIVGSSALVFGWLAYLLARAYFARRIVWILGAAFAIFFFGGLFSGLVPTVHSDVAWQANVCGFAAGVGAAWWLHPRKGSTRAARQRDPLMAERGVKRRRFT
jgi:membrane associated rhomboid family serine protease